MRRLLRDVAEGRPLGDTTTLADAGVVESHPHGRGHGRGGLRSTLGRHAEGRNAMPAGMSLPQGVRGRGGGRSSSSSGLLGFVGNPLVGDLTATEPSDLRDGRGA